MRKILVGAVSLAIGIVLTVALPASAHHNTIKGSVACASETNTWTVTWQVTNSESDKNEKITASSREGAVPVGTVINKGATRSFTETVIDPATLTLTLSAEWVNRVTSTNSGTVDKSSFDTGCWPEPEKVFIQAGSIPGHDECGVANDIQPSHTTGPEYDVVRDGADWVFTIKDNDEYANYYFDANAEKVLRVPVGEEPSTAADCPSPVIPDVAQTSQCGVEGVVYLPENTDLITYAFEGDSDGHGPGHVTVVATLHPTDYVTAWGDLPFGWHLQENGTATFGVLLWTADECPNVLVPVAPQVVQAQCTGPGQFTDPAVIPADGPEGVTYTVSGSVEQGGTVQVIASTKGADVFDEKTLPEGWTFIDSHTASYEVSFSSVDCIVKVTPVAPEVTQSSRCDKPGSVSTAAVEGIHYTWLKGSPSMTSGAYEIVASAKDGYQIPDGVQTTYQGTLAAPEKCPTPSHNPPAAAGPTLPNTGGVAWSWPLLGSVLVAGGVMMVTASRRTRRHGEAPPAV